MRPNQRLEIYWFALFNEDMKPGPTSERNYGLYQPDGTMAYDVGLAPVTTSTASVSSLTSSAAKGHKKELGSLWYLIFLISLIFQAQRGGLISCENLYFSLVISSLFYFFFPPWQGKLENHEPFFLGFFALMDKPILKNDCKNSGEVAKSEKHFGSGVHCK